MGVLIAPKNSSGCSKNTSDEPIMISWVANDRAAARVYRLSSENKAFCAIFNTSVLSPIDSLARNSDKVGRPDKISSV